ncbi:MAG: transcription repressor NadR [Oscillospiraceae bacterium]|nr:transcription repressor NadR [Oscillospiraceae bacterium]
MRADERRSEISALLHTLSEPVSGGELAKRFGVSRQIIVQDISVLKAAGFEILSTHNGYILQTSPQAHRVFKVHHTTAETEDELSRIVALGGTVVDVFVWHKVYGKVEAKLNIFSPLHVRQFIEGVRSGKSIELMNITGGYHYHTIRAENEAVLDRIQESLESGGYLAKEKEA